MRIALATLRYPASPDESVALAVRAVEEAARRGAGVVCLPEAYVPGYRGLGHDPGPPSVAFLDQAWACVAGAAKAGRIGVVLGTERVRYGRPVISALVLRSDGTIAGFQDKVQLDPGEEATYAAGAERQLFKIEGLTFGVVICHEGWRYPETVRWAARRGAQVVFHPHLSEGEGDYRPTGYADPQNTFHEKAALCRAAENTIFYAGANYATPRANAASAVVRPDGSLQCWHPHHEEGLLIADLDLSLATGLLARRCRS